MREVFVICEGPTELSFVKDVLASYLAKRQLYLTPTQIGKPRHKGGGVTYHRLLSTLKPRLLGNSQPVCTTLIDYYGLLATFPGKRKANELRDIAAKADCIHTALQTRLAEDFDEYTLRRFVPYVQMHEFEGLLFSDPAAFARAIGKPSLESAFAGIRNAFATPEHIDDSPNTAPSKRVISLVDDYQKVIMGRAAALEIGIKPMREQCSLFSDWLDRLTTAART